MKKDPYKTVRSKVNKIFTELVGDKAKELDDVAHSTREVIESVLKKKWGKNKAEDIAFHLCDWNYDAAFLVALHLYPERFTKEEIKAGIDLFIVHAPNHIGAAAFLLENPIMDSFEHELK
jgi:hypothetical protein